MAQAPLLSRRVLKKAAPALALALGIFVTLLFLIRYTGAFYLVILAWIIVPVAFVRFWRWAGSRLTGGSA